MSTDFDLPHSEPFHPDPALPPGTHAAWDKAPWLPLVQVGGPPGGGATRAKLLWSPAGIHVLVDCVDDLLNCTLHHDGADLFKEDCVEIFLQPDAGQELYLEYELSPLGKHLVLLVANAGNGFHGWTAWHDDGWRAVRRAVAVRGGPQASGAAISGWTAECLIPWDLLRGFRHIPGTAGMTWRGNVYRLDRSAEGATSAWALAPAVGEDFHDAKNFGRLHFR